MTIMATSYGTCVNPQWKYLTNVVVAWKRCLSSRHGLPVDDRHKWPLPVEDHILIPVSVELMMCKTMHGFLKIPEDVDDQ